MSDRQPMVLFPMRLEIYNSPPGAGAESRIRWYPDESQIFPQVTGTSDADRTAQTAYRAALEEISGDPSIGAQERENRKKAAWLSLVRRVGLNRARRLAGEGGDDGVKRFSESSEEQALHRFLEEGAPLRMLPERVLLYTMESASGRRTVAKLAQGKPIPKEIALSLADRTGAGNWAFDFDAALSNGMAVKISDPALLDQLSRAQWLLAVGCKRDSDSNELLEELLLRFKSLGELEVLARNTPTNNTEQTVTDFRGNENGTARESEMPEEPPRTEGVEGGDFLCAALGLERGVFAGVKNEALREQRAALAANRMLWYVCTRDHRDAVLNFNTAKGTYRTSQQYEKWRSLSGHFMRYVLGRGLLPSLRLGDNPYGLLPVTDLEAWQPCDDEKRDPMLPNVAAVSRILKKKFLKLAAGEPETSYRVPGLAEVPRARKLSTLLQLLQRHAVSRRVDIQRICDVEGQAKRFDADPRRFPNPLVSFDQSTGNILRLAGRYAAFAARGYICDGTGKADPEFRGSLDQAHLRSLPLLEWLLLYQLVLLERDCEACRRDADASQKQGDGANAKRLLEQRRELMQLARMIAQELEELKGASVRQMEELLLEVLDSLCSRLDAWVCSLANRRLATISDQSTLQRRCQGGNYVGVFGWLERPFVQGSPRSQGFFQAPSLDQATAGVLMRNASLNGNDGKAFQIDLASGRARKAVWFLAGMRKGFSAAELFGYRAERLLHERGLDRYIPQLRAYYPLLGQDEAGAKASGASVINGEALMRGDQPAVASPPSGIPPVELDKVVQELLKVRDAVSDLCLAEAVYQSVKGNAPRAAAWLEAAEGKNVPPEPELLTTPRTGITKEQRVILPLLEDPGDNGSGEPRVIADPALARFCAARLAPLAGALFKVTVCARQTGEAVYVTPLSLNDLGMTGIDLVVGGKAELETRTRALLCRLFAQARDRFPFPGETFFDAPLPASLDEHAFVEFEYDFAGNGTPLFCDLLARAGQLQLFLASVRPFTLDDVPARAYLASDPEYLEKMVAKKMEVFALLRARCDRLAEAFHHDWQLVKNSTAGSEAERDELQQLLRRLAGYGVAEAMIPPVGSLLDSLDQALQGHASRFDGAIDTVTVEVKGRAPLLLRLAGPGGFEQQAQDGSGWQEVSQTSLRLTAADAFIEGAVALIKKRTQQTMPVFAPVSLVDEERIVRPAPGAPDDGRRCSVSYFADSLASYGRVRRNVGLLDKIYPDGALVFSRTGIQRSWEEALAQAFEGSQQRPHIERPQGWTQSGVDLHYVSPEGEIVLKTDRIYTAFLVDGWTDFTANAEETSAAAAHYAGPKNCAPNLLLLALPPKGEWGGDLEAELAGVVAETVELMQVRTVCGEMVAGSNLGYLLPALLFYGECTRLPSEPYPLYGKRAETGFKYQV